MIDKLLLSLGYQFSSYEVASEILKILAFLKLNVKLIKIVSELYLEINPFRRLVYRRVMPKAERLSEK